MIMIMINIFIISAYERFNIKNGDNHKFFNIFITLLGWQSFLKYTLLNLTSPLVKNLVPPKKKMIFLVIGGVCFFT